jgi:hypothetical protein
MKPPFWEVTVRRQVPPSQAPVIESVNCFAEKRDAEHFRIQALREDSSLLITVRLVMAAMPSSALMRYLSAVA